MEIYYRLGSSLDVDLTPRGLSELVSELDVLSEKLKNGDIPQDVTARTKRLHATIDRVVISIRICNWTHCEKYPEVSPSRDYVAQFLSNAKEPDSDSPVYAELGDHIYQSSELAQRKESPVHDSKDASSAWEL